MTVLVQNCFHWIGFHMVNQLLEAGYKVKGIDLLVENKSEHLSMLFARNSSFSVINPNEEDTFNTAIVIDSPYSSATVKATRYIIINETYQHSDAKSSYIKQPMLFGKWMPIVDDGLYYLNKHITFDSDEFLENAIYITDFTKMIIQLLQNKNITEVLNVQYDRTGETTDLILDNTAHIRDNTPIESKVKEVLEHYKRFENYY